MSTPTPGQPYRYFVSFSIPYGFGNCVVSLVKPIRGQSDVQAVHKTLTDSGVERPVLLHFIQLPD